jgi:hypothetical protein
MWTNVDNLIDKITEANLGYFLHIGDSRICLPYVKRRQGPEKINFKKLF